METVERQWEVGSVSLTQEDPTPPDNIELGEQFPDVVPEDAAPIEETNYQNLAIQVVSMIMRIINEGDQIAFLIVNPKHTEGLRAALMAFPDDVYPPQLKEQLPLTESDAVEGVQVVSGSDLEKQFLERYYGPREIGGTGLIPTLGNYLKATNSPVRITVEFLRLRFLQEAAERCVPQIIVPTGAELQRGVR